MPAIRAADAEARRVAAAMLRLEGKRNSEIAAILGVDESTAKRLLDSRKGDYWRESGFAPGPKLAGLPSELLRTAKAVMSGPAIKVQELELLARAPQRHLRSVTIVPASWGDWQGDGQRAGKRAGQRSEPERWRAWMHEFSRLAAPRARLLMMRGAAWGVTWGSHLAALVAAIEALPEGAYPRRRGVLTLPLSGERCGARLASESPSALAEALQRALAGRVDRPLSVGMVPAFISGKFSASQVLTMWDFISNSAAYCQIFGAARIPARVRPLRAPMRGLVEKLDGVLTSISRDNHPFGYGLGRMYEDAGYSRDEVESAYLGDLGGVGLLRPNREPHERLEARRTGIERAHLFACAARAAARSGDAVGVVLVASGADRAESLLASVHLGYVTHLIADRSLSERLMQLLAERGLGGTARRR